MGKYLLSTNMRLTIERKQVKVYPDSKRVIARFFFNGDERAKEVIQHVMALEEEKVFSLISPLLQEFSKRHRNITKILYRHCEKVKVLFKAVGVDYEKTEAYRKLLVGSYFTHEYSIESAAFFNPSIIEDPDQSDLEEGEMRMIISFRAVGEGHISSIVFRRALIDKNHDITVIPAGNYIDEAEIIRTSTYNKKLFLQKALDNKINSKVLEEVGGKLEDKFEYVNLRRVIIDSRNLQMDNLKKLEYDKIITRK